MTENSVDTVDTVDSVDTVDTVDIADSVDTVDHVAVHRLAPAVTTGSNMVDSYVTIYTLACRHK